jgi:hypothetical protein
VVNELIIQYNAVCNNESDERALVSSSGGQSMERTYSMEDMGVNSLVNSVVETEEKKIRFEV